MEEIHQLVLVKALAEESERHLGRRSALSNGLAVSLAQDSVELFLRCVARHRRLELEERAVFDAMVAKVQADVAAIGLVVPRIRLNELNRARVSFKHYGLTPTDDDASRLTGYGIEFVQSALLPCFGLDWDQISLSDLIQPADVRDRLKAAEEFLAEGKYREAIEATAVAMQWSERAMKSLLPDPDHRLTDLARLVPDARLSHSVQSALQYLVQYLGELRSLGVCAMLDVDPKALRRFRDLAPHVSTMSDGSIRITHRPRSHAEAEVRFCIDFVRSFSLRLQDRL